MADSRKKASMFLQLVTRDTIEESHATELLKQMMKKSKTENKSVTESDREKIPLPSENSHIVRKIFSFSNGNRKSINVTLGCVCC